MKTIKRILALFSLVLVAASAPAQTPVGKMYTPGAFDRIEIDGSAKVKLSQGDRDQVFIAGDDGAQQRVELEVSHNRLTIRPSGSWKFWNNSRLQIEVQMRQVSQVILSGASDLHAPGAIKSDKLYVGISGAGSARFDELNVDQMKFDISGAGDGQLAGLAGELKLSVSGKGKLLAEQLRAAGAQVSISGVGKANLWVTDTLRVSISGVGSVDYWGQPKVERSTSGLGSINGLGDKR
jgi:hypothetical protein